MQRVEELAVQPDDSETRKVPKKPRLSWLAPAAVSAVLAAVIVATAVSTVRSPEASQVFAGDDRSGVAIVGRPAPDFEVELISGARFSLQEAGGKVVVVNFWGTWCAPCEQEMPLLERASQEYREDAVVIGLAVNDSQEAVMRFVSSRGITFPIALDDGRVAGFYLVSGFPTTVIVGRDGVVVSRVSRAFSDYEEVRDQLLRAI